VKAKFDTIYSKSFEIRLNSMNLSIFRDAESKTELDLFPAICNDIHRALQGYWRRSGLPMDATHRDILQKLVSPDREVRAKLLAALGSALSSEPDAKWPKAGSENCGDLGRALDYSQSVPPAEDERNGKIDECAQQ